MNDVCMVVDRLDGEHWWGGRVADGAAMPLTVGACVDLAAHLGNQAAPVLVSSRGRVLAASEPFAFEVEAERLVLDRGVGVEHPGETLRDAVIWAAQHVHHTPRAMPNVAMFKPQWALWIELLYEPTQAKTLAYARDVLSHGYEPGVVMIDDNWSEDYGTWKFRADRFPNPKAMVDELHAAGFPVMLWVCPYVSPDGPNYLDLRNRGLLVRDSSGEPAIRRWWNGYSAILDLTNPDTVAWFGNQLRALQHHFGIDGFKFDGGDVDMYRPDDVTTLPTTPSDQVHRYGLFAEQFDFNELRAGWDLGGRGLAMRLSDANHSWDQLGLGKLIGNQLAQGLLGMPFGAPDMIGGGQYLDFNEECIDPELFVRHAQIAAFCPMMQFSAAPWRLLDDDHAAAVKAAANLRSLHHNRIVQLAHHAVETGEPIIRPLEYEFPHQGFATVTDCFLLGPDLLVAPITERHATRRTVHLPPGTWQSSDGRKYAGSQTIQVDVTLDTIPHYRLLDH